MHCYLQTMSCPQYTVKTDFAHLAEILNHPHRLAQCFNFNVATERGIATAVGKFSIRFRTAAHGVDAHQTVDEDLYRSRCLM